MKGQKTCSKCNAITGPRAFNCPACGAGFVMKGIKQPDIDKNSLTLSTSIVAQAKKVVVVDDTANQERLDAKVLAVLNPIDDIGYRTKYHASGNSWVSKDGLYLIREINTFMGVNVKEHYGHPYCLMVKVFGRFELTPKSRFKTLGGTIKYMERHRATNKSRT